MQRTGDHGVPVPLDAPKAQEILRKWGQKDYKSQRTTEFATR